MNTPKKKFQNSIREEEAELEVEHEEERKEEVGLEVEHEEAVCRSPR